MDKRENKEKSDEQGSNSEPILIRSDDEDEDLSLKIIEKAKLRPCSNVEDKVREEKNVDTTKALNTGDCEAEKNPVEVSDNAVLRRLLRGPRYFDSPDKSWGTCYNCGEEGHAAVNCTSARRKKPCFVCGSFEHNAKNCAKGKACFICKKGGHRANDCPERSHGGSQSSKICLKCGDSGHDMFSCWSNYSADDLKEIQCYICKSYGHLCCAKYPDSGPREFSCYRCGLLGHTGLACTASRGETSFTGSLNPCYRCGEEGHFARECTNMSRAKKRNHESSTPKKKVQKKRKEQKEFRSVPRDFGRAWKKGKSEGGYTSGYKAKRRGGWIPDDPEDYPQPNSWRSPSTPRNKRAKISNFSTGGHASASRLPRKSNRLDFDNSASYGSDNYHHHRFSASGDFHSPYGSGKYHHHHRFSASQFGNSSHDRWRRNNDW
ncbi:protein AIR1-like isoform X2 [Lycium barbarum]|uniref:protein AIR1-like isoform X2 n=1 Tax=Lycium barbarum TaxID=112863 RepID=UPI00293F14D9|nr:protein AIR1-like isoform X2 [Lycium barbarum]